MLSLNRIRENPDAIQQDVEAKGEQVDFNVLLDLDKQHREIQTQVNDLRAERNRVSEKIAAVKRSGGDDDDAIAAMREVGNKIKTLEDEADSFKAQIHSALEVIPNTPHESVPIGKDETDNKVVKEWGEKPVFDYDIKDHLELGSALNLLDFDRAAKIAGSGFPLYINLGAKLERALINYMLDFHIRNIAIKKYFRLFLLEVHLSIHVDNCQNLQMICIILKKISFI